MCVAHAMEAATASFADRLAVVDGDCMHDYASLWEAVQLFAAELAEAGVFPGQRAAVYVGSGFEALLALLSVEYLGATAMPLDIYDSPEDTERALAQAGADHIIGHIGDGHLVEELVGDISATGVSVLAVAGDYTLVRRRRASARPGGRGGFVFGLSGGVGAITVDGAALTAAAEELGAAVSITADDVVAVSGTLTGRAVVTVVLAALSRGACLSLRGHRGPVAARVDRQLREDAVSVLVCSLADLVELRAAGVRAPGLRVLALPRGRAADFDLVRCRALLGLGGGRGRFGKSADRTAAAPCACRGRD
ncbi:AMP-binding protein [Nocardia puris]|nr:AMP-binding protein [Nocardia puris]